MWGGPGSGKSTTAADLFALMKWKNINVELVNEYAKELSWEGRHTVLEDQLYIMAKQNRKLWRIKDKVDWAISDSPIAMSTCYAKSDYFPKHYRDFGHELWNYYDNVNIFLKRVKPFHQVGRHHNEEESTKLDITIKQLLDDYKYPYIEVDGDENAKTKIFEYIQGMI